VIALLATVLLQAQAIDSVAVGHPAGSAVSAERVDRPPVLDGRLDDPAWARATPITTLIQRDPDEGAPSSERVAVRVLYDADALFVGARLFDSDPHDIVSRLGRRDAATHSDEFRVLLDSYHDHRTAFEFIVNPAGVQTDILLGGDGSFSDASWDPVWSAATAVDSLGWTAEIRIPLSQLRFSPAPVQVWGVRFERWIQRKNELAMFPFTAKTATGLASHFAHLVGLHDLAAPRRIELVPYGVARGSYYRPDVPDNPFDHPDSYFGDAGVDVKYGVSSNLTLDATVNPDFGQVALDPAFVNLTAFEQFLSERRPFFIEGTEIFDFGGNGGGIASAGSAPLFFYSRRIGRPPEGATTSPGQFVDMPEETTILGAAKLSGRRADGWSIGVLDAVTAREWATVADTTTGQRARDEVEPPTNYFVARLKRDLRGGNTTLGALAAAVHRNLETSNLDPLRSDAYGAGVDLFHRWGHNTYTLAASLGGSDIRGDPLAIQQAQRSSNRYFQRPDAQRLHYDPTRVSLNGETGSLSLSKVAGAWNWSLAGGTVSPGFEVNDLGYQTRVDRISAVAAARRRWTRPGPVFRQALASFSLAHGWNYDGNLLERTGAVYAFAQLHNFWSSDLAASYSAGVFDDRLTRGGPLARKPPGWQASADLSTDDRRALSAYLYLGYGRDTAGGWSVNIAPLLTLRAGAVLTASLGPAYTASRGAAQYVGAYADPAATATLGTRYVFATLLQQSLNVTLRLNTTISPACSIQLYAQPFTFTGEYRGFKELRASRTYEFTVYGRDGGSTLKDTLLVSGTDTVPGYVVDPGGGGNPFTIADRDFRTRSLRISGVLRWEYRPGSTIYLVWTQRRSGYFPFDDRFDIGRDLGSELLLDRPTNVLLVKVNFWLSP